MYPLPTSRRVRDPCRSVPAALAGARLTAAGSPDLSPGKAFYRPAAFPSAVAVHITYFVHGTSTDNERRVASGWSDAPLSDLGIQQATELRERIKDQHFDIVFCSDLRRAADSAALAFGDATPIVADARLRECNYGTYNATPLDTVEALQPHNINHRFPDGESYQDVKERMAEYLDFLRHHYEGKHVAIVAHKAPQLALEVLVKGKTWKQAFAEDWRRTKAWRPGWDYRVE
jgi:broad specificity phosphatase PhoE